MTSVEQTAKVTVIEIAKLDLAPGNAVAIICPEDWLPQHMVRFGEYLKACLKRIGVTAKFILFPFGTQLSIIVPEKTKVATRDDYEMSDAEKNPHDDGLPWGFLVEPNIWVELPKVPMLLAQLGPPPFNVELSDGTIRHIIHNPDQSL